MYMYDFTSSCHPNTIIIKYCVYFDEKLALC